MLLAAREKQSRAADGPEQKGEIHRRSEHRRAQIRLRYDGRVARAKREVRKDPGVFAERDLVVGAAVDVVEHDFREPALRQAAKVGDVDGARHIHRAWSLSLGWHAAASHR